MITTIQGSDDLVTWFGRWPSFHDAEIVSVRIERDGKSTLRIRAWVTGDRTNDRGEYIREREAIVVFELRGIRQIRLEGEDADTQNVIAALTIEQLSDGYRIELSPSYGLSGQVVARELSVRLER